MKKVLVVLALQLTVVSLSAVADTLYSGIDTWSTKADGKSFHDFAGAPLPAGFFCDRSTPFTGRIALRGEPIASDEPKLLGSTDTIIERIDDASFNTKGVATTRIRFRGLNLVSISPIQTACGAYNVRVNLVGEQPITTMRIFKEGSDFGRFLAPMALQAKISFAPVSGHGSSLQVVRTVRFASNPRNKWFMRPTEKLRGVPSLFKVDTDGDGIPDAYLPGPSNFAAGGQNKNDGGVDNCHRGYDAYHCPYPDGSWALISSPGLLPLCTQLCCTGGGSSSSVCETDYGLTTTCGPPYAYFCSN